MVWGMPIFYQIDPHSSLGFVDDSCLLAIHMLGIWHDWAIQECPSGFRWVYVAIDKFSKWVEYKPLVQSATKKLAELFNDIIHRFGLPNSIITDLGSTFTSSDFYEDRCISIKYVSVMHPRANGQVEQANNIILDALKKRLYEKDQKHLSKWLKELQAMV